LDEREVIVDILNPPILAGFYLEEIVVLYKLLDRSLTVRMLQGCVFLSRELVRPYSFF
jgi:hypothetical protein